MATIQINRTDTGVVPGALAAGELYIDRLNNKLYWSDSTGVIRSMTLLLPTFAASATTDTTNATNITTGRLSAAIGGVPAGAVMAFATQAVPTGWFECNGAAVNRVTYAALFAAIGTTFGVGDGATTFNLPDMRGRFARAWDHGAGVDTGRAFGSTQNDDLKAHTHSVTDPGHTHNVSNDSGAGTTDANIQSNRGNGGPAYNALARSATTGITIASTGGTETRPKNIALMYCIKT